MKVSRAIITSLLLTAGAARAHSTALALTSPSSDGVVPVQGVVTVTWTGQETAHPAALLSLFASPRSPSPFEPPAGAGDVHVTASPLPVAYGIDRFDWSTSGIAAGCWHPYAVVSQPDEPDELHFAPGAVLVPGGGASVATVTLSNALADRPNAQGIFTLKYRTESPSAAAHLKLEWVAPAGTSGTLAGDLAAAQGSAEGSFDFDTAALSPGVYALRATVTNADGVACDAYWNGQLTVAERAAPAPTSEPQAPHGEQLIGGCSAAAGQLLLAALLLARRRRGARRSLSSRATWSAART